MRPAPYTPPEVTHAHHRYRVERYGEIHLKIQKPTRRIQGAEWVFEIRGKGILLRADRLVSTFLGAVHSTFGGVLRLVPRLFGAVFCLVVGMLCAVFDAMPGVASSVGGFMPRVFHILLGGLLCCRSEEHTS